MDGPWEVVKQEPMTVAMPDGSYGPVIRVHFRTAAGNRSYVDVPRDQYNADTARAMVDTHAKELDAVKPA